MGKRYKNPPIVEVVCEFLLTQDTSWDLTVPGVFYERVRDEFPHREQRVSQEVDLVQEPQGLRQILRTTERILLFTRDRKFLIQLGPRLMVINALKPYPGWEEFRPRIQKAWEELKRTVEIRGLERISLRYINRIEFDEKEINLKDYFEFYPVLGPRLPQGMEAFIAGAEFSYEKGRDHCRVQLVSAPETGDKKVVILDIHYFLAQLRSIEAPEMLPWIEGAHDRVEDVFEGCITDRLRERFEEIS